MTLQSWDVSPEFRLRPSEIYRHYKGGRYLVLGLAETHEHDGRKDVVYISLTHGKMVTRPLERDSRKEDSWSDIVEWPDGARRERFVLERIIPPSQLERLQSVWSKELLAEL